MMLLVTQERAASSDDLVEQFAPAVLRLCRRLLAHAADGEDAAQEVLIRLYRNREKLDQAQAPSAWVYRVAVNVCLDFRRRRRPVEAVDEGVLAGGRDPEALLRSQERVEQIEAALARLPEKERAALVLRDLEDLPTSEVARVLGSSEATVRSQIASARLKLRKWL